jgi:hypothetical protein
MVSRALLFFVGHYVSRVRIESIPEDVNINLVVFEVIYASPLTICIAGAHYTALTHVASQGKRVLFLRKIWLHLSWL